MHLKCMRDASGMRAGHGWKHAGRVWDVRKTHLVKRIRASTKPHDKAAARFT